MSLSTIQVFLRSSHHTSMNSPVVIAKVYNIITVTISAENVFYLAGHVLFHFPTLAGRINKFCPIINIRSNLHTYYIAFTV